LLLRYTVARDDYLCLLQKVDPMPIFGAVSTVDDFSDELGRDFTGSNRLDIVACSFLQRKLRESAGRDENPHIRAQVIELGTSLLYPLNVLWALPVAAFNTDDALVTGDRPNRHDVNFAGRFRGNVHHLD
jgi:hypothetical protein